MQNVNESNIFTPLTENLAKQFKIQIILFKKILYRWIRGGVPSAQTVRDMDYFSRSNDSNVVKQLLKNKKSYL